jgi:hypothetical protein
MNQPYYIVIEEQEYPQYSAVIDPKKILILDPEYKRQYDCFDNLGLTKSTGPGPARNFAWDHSIKNGYEWHWVMDDNIKEFLRLTDNKKIRFGDGTCFKIMEDFCLRYSNVAMAGPNYRAFASQNSVMPPFVMNTRIYSCNLIRNDTPYRWRGRYNEDTDICLRVLKDGDCTIQFNAFLQGKAATQTVKGGNTEEFYHKEFADSDENFKKTGYNSSGTINKSQMLADMHPDVARVVWRYGRWHHYVDYNPFKVNKLKMKPEVVIPEGNNEYGMKLIHDWKPE